MAVGTTNFPTSLDTVTELIRVANLAESTIGTGGVDASATTIPVTNTASAPADGVAWCGTEAISYTGKTGTTLTGCVRGFDGTTAATHAAGDAILFDAPSSAHHEVLVNSIIAIETLLGAQGQNIHKPLYARHLTANGSATATTISPFFATNPGIPLVSGEAYELVTYLNFLKNTAGTLTWTLTFSAAPTWCNASLDTDVAAGAALGAAQTATAPLRSNIVGATGAAVAFGATASITAATYHEHRIIARFVAGSNSNVRINVTNSAGTVTPIRGSRYELYRLVDIGTTVA